MATSGIGTSGIRVTPEQLAHVAAQLVAGAGNVEGLLQQLAAHVAPLGGDWAGLAQARFQELWAQWHRDARGLQEALTGIARLMAHASSSYESTERSIASAFEAW
ncbi:MAG TPA: WXG100 family type VII secretion target [Actinomycetes bacterium]|nr:WXG100 family type VII secretion target [Actinomycetes bacterium]